MCVCLRVRATHLQVLDHALRLKLLDTQGLLALFTHALHIHTTLAPEDS